MKKSKAAIEAARRANVIPLPGLTIEQTLAIPRQQRYKLRRKAAGLCVGCGKEKIAEGLSELCLTCSAKQRERMRKSTGAVARYTTAPSYAGSKPTADRPRTKTRPPSPRSRKGKAPTVRPPSH